MMKFSEDIDFATIEIKKLIDKYTVWLENEKLKSSLDSANDLLGFFQSQDNSKYKKINEQLSTKNFDLEQINHNLKRENFNLKSEKEEIKLELDKIKSFRNKESIDISGYSTYQMSGKLYDTEKDFDNSQIYNSNSHPERKKEDKEKFMVDEKLSENDNDEFLINIYKENNDNDSNINNNTEIENLELNEFIEDLNNYENFDFKTKNIIYN